MSPASPSKASHQPPLALPGVPLPRPHSCRYAHREAQAGKALCPRGVSEAGGGGAAQVHTAGQRSARTCGWPSPPPPARVRAGGRSGFQMNGPSHGQTGPRSEACAQTPGKTSPRGAWRAGTELAFFARCPGNSWEQRRPLRWLFWEAGEKRRLGGKEPGPFWWALPAPRRANLKEGQRPRGPRRESGGPQLPRGRQGERVPSPLPQSPFQLPQDKMPKRLHAWRGPPALAALPEEVPSPGPSGQRALSTRRSQLPCWGLRSLCWVTWGGCSRLLWAPWSQVTSRVSSTRAGVMRRLCPSAPFCFRLDGRPGGWRDEARAGPGQTRGAQPFVFLPFPAVTLLGDFLSSDANEVHPPRDTLSPSPKGRTGARGPSRSPAPGPRASWLAAHAGHTVRAASATSRPVSRAWSLPHCQEGGGLGHRPPGDSVSGAALPLCSVAPLPQGTQGLLGGSPLSCPAWTAGRGRPRP